MKEIQKILNMGLEESHLFLHVVISKFGENFGADFHNGIP